MRFWFRKQMKPFEVSTSVGDIQIEIFSGGICVWDAEGESWVDGWSTLEDIAELLVERANPNLPPDEALFVAAEAVETWVEWLESN